MTRKIHAKSSVLFVELDLSEGNKEVIKSSMTVFQDWGISQLYLCFRCSCTILS